MQLKTQANPFAQTGVEPELAEFLVSIRARIVASVGSNPTIETQRRASRAARLDWSLTGPEVPVIPTPDFGLPSRLFRPENSRDSSLLVYFHGGGWIMHDLDSHDRLMRAYALQSGFAVLGLDYPLAPEVQFPQNLFACVDAVERIIQNAAEIGVQPDQIFLGGDSSGANLALSLELHRQANGRPPLAGLLLTYGVFDSDLSRPSYGRFGVPPYLLTDERIEFFWAQYCRQDSERANPLAAPLRADISALASLPPVHLCIAGQDVLLDENLLMADRLQAAGVDVSHMVYENTAHGFIEAVNCSPVADQAIADAATWLRNLQI